MITQHYPALAYSGYRRYWFGSFASVGGTQLITLGQAWLVFELSGSALTLGYLGLAAALPNLLMTLFGGVVADRFDKRRVLMATSFSTMTALILLTLLDYAGQVQVWHVLLVAAFNSLITGLDWPTRSAIFPLLVERPAYMSAVALNAFIWQSTRMAIPALGGVLLAATDTWVVFALGAAGFLGMFLVLATLKVPHVASAPSPALQQIAQGLRFIRHTPIFINLLALSFAGSLLSMAYIQILPVFADVLGRGEAAYGTLLSAGGVGSVLGTLLTGGVEKRTTLGRLMVGCATASAVLLIGFAYAASAGLFYLSLALATCQSLFASAFMVMTMSVLQLKVPDTLRGRVMGIYSMGFSLVPLGGLLLGSLSEWSNPGTAVIIANIGYLLILVLLGWLQPRIRELNGNELIAVTEESNNGSPAPERAGSARQAGPEAAQPRNSTAQLPDERDPEETAREALGPSAR
ncbi:MAG: MFS transporter [Pseudomonadota bacterium]